MDAHLQLWAQGNPSVLLEPNAQVTQQIVLFMQAASQGLFVYHSPTSQLVNVMTCTSATDACLSLHLLDAFTFVTVRWAPQVLPAWLQRMQSKPSCG